MKKIMLDLREAVDREEVHARIAEMFSFPEYYGRNLDALYDCLTELSEDTCVGIYGSDEASAYEKRVICVFREAERENGHLCVFVFPE
ncbi:MAG: barstar family protein [Lachnospiraceae bacterium]|nr:barstar family protein [Lachnospiraceae bacterium]